jgi:hypothetical protein
MAGRKRLQPQGETVEVYDDLSITLVDSNRYYYDGYEWHEIEQPDEEADGG